MLETPIHVEAQHLKFGDTIQKAFYGETVHVIESVTNDNGSQNVWLSPTDGLGLDEKFAVPKQFCFEVIGRLSE